MKPDEILDAMEHIDAELIEAAGQAPRRSSMPGVIAALAAMLVLVIGIAFLMGKSPNGPLQIGIGPHRATSSTQHVHASGRCPCGWSPFPTFAPTTNPTQPPYSSGPSHSSPSNFCFERLYQLKQMLAIAKTQPDELINYVHSENIGYWSGFYPTSDDVALLEAWLQSTPVPCRNDHSDTMLCIYYHPARFYDKDRLEIFYDIDGIRYCFMICDSPAWNPDGEEVTTVQIGSISAEMREGSYGNSRRLMAHFYVNDVVISMWVNTTDPSKVDLSGFYLSIILAIE